MQCRAVNRYPENGHDAHQGQSFAFPKLYTSQSYSLQKTFRYERMHYAQCLSRGKVLLRELTSLRLSYPFAISFHLPSPLASPLGPNCVVSRVALRNGSRCRSIKMCWKEVVSISKGLIDRCGEWNKVGTVTFILSNIIDTDPAFIRRWHERKQGRR